MHSIITLLAIRMHVYNWNNCWNVRVFNGLFKIIKRIFSSNSSYNFHWIISIILPINSIFSVVHANMQPMPTISYMFSKNFDNVRYTWHQLSHRQVKIIVRQRCHWIVHRARRRWWIKPKIVILSNYKIVFNLLKISEYVFLFRKKIDIGILIRIYFSLLF